jgi:hypothetical protein
MPVDPFGAPLAVVPQQGQIAGTLLGDQYVAIGQHQPGKIADPISQATMSAPQLAALRSASDGSLLLNGERAGGQGSRRWIAIGETTGSEPLTTPTSAGADAAVAGGFNPAPGGGIAGTAIRRRQGLRRRHLAEDS